MFGYVKPFKPEMRFCEFDIYKGVYCSLCKQLGKTYGLISRMFLNYDFAFLAMLFMAVNEDKPTYNKTGCIIHPFKKQLCVDNNRYTLFAADIFVLTMYYKVKDNINDGNFFERIKYRTILPYFNHLRKKALCRVKDCDDIMITYMENQEKVESNANSTVDEACEPTAVFMSKICMLISEDKMTERVLERFGYFFGRYIYLADAFDDMEDDKKSGNFNPLLHNSSKPEHLINGSLGELSLAYELLKLKRYKPILDNIVFLGLNRSIMIISNKKISSKKLLNK